MTQLGPKFMGWLISRGFDPNDVSKMSRETRLQHDLEFIGDNLFDILKAIHNDFKIDFSEFDWRRYTPDEGYILSFRNIFKSYRRLVQEALTWVEPITLGMLEDAIERGRWVAADTRESESK